VIQVGIRSLSLGEKEYLEKSSSRLFYASELMKNEGWEKEVISSLSERVYITIDLDVFDPSIMPAVGTPEPGGLGWYQALKLLRLVSLSRSIVGFDVVELCPIPGCVAPDFLAARLTYRLIGYSFFKTSED
jgi:agmatinase